MRDSVQRVQYIIEYLNSYKTKIEALNKNGLFDTATLYELFAAEVCKLWFGQGFTNLNTVRPNYPYIDLVSDDGEIYVQVSTVQDIPVKIKSTLEKIKNSKDASFSKLKTLYFFVLGNDSIERVPDYSGQKRIGKIDFSPETHLIANDDIINKAKTDLGFQLSLYDLLQKESKTFQATAEKFDEIVRYSKSLIQSDVNGLINGEYEIRRDDLISKIKSEDCQYISIIGDAGSGKTAICKKLILDEELYLFTRAEKISEVMDIDSIWSLNVKKLLQYLNGKRIIFYIDALEFIADGKKTFIDRLQHLYEVTRDFNNAYIITSCRTSDKNAFMRLTSTYEIQEYPVPELTDSEITQIALKYPIIGDLRQQNRYSQLLKSPFYLNMIVSQVKSADDLIGTNGLRGYIWDNAICLKNKALPTGITSDEIRNAVNTIVFTRAKEFSVGIPKDDIPNHILKVLLSNGVVLQTNDKLRLTYDIFEDICFEQRFDREFDINREDFRAFFANLTDLGSCVYRRYQIWVENKLFIKEGRENFLYSLVFSDSIPEDWKKQTIIGITKSRFCKDFFFEYGPDLIERGLIFEFLEITNLFSFETHIIKMSNGNHYAILRPVGVGREQLIQLAKEKKLYEKDEYKRTIKKTCTDYAKSPSFEALTATAACEILEIYVDQLCQQAVMISSYSIGKEAIEILRSLYLMAEFCIEWLRDFWKKALKDYRAYSSSITCRLAEETIKDIFKNTTPGLANVLPTELTELAWIYWVDRPERKADPFQYHASFLDIEDHYGLNINASHYSHFFGAAQENSFLRCLALTHFEIALRWVINLTNYATNSLRQNVPERVHTVELVDYPSHVTYVLWGTEDFFFAGMKEYGVPELIGDAVFTVRQAVFARIEYYVSKGDYEHCTWFVKWVKRIILEESNNTMLLTIIEDVGLNYPVQIPGFSIFFASSIDYVMIDTERELAQMGMKDFWGKRYQGREQSVFSLKDYIIKNQLFGRPEDKEQCEKTIDFLYSIIPNDAEHAIQYLQIQKMDLRMAKRISCGEGFYLSPQITGAAKEAAESYEKSRTTEEQRTISRLNQQYKDSNKGLSLSIEACLRGIEELKRLLASSENGVLANRAYIEYISCALSKNELIKETRSIFCQLWVDGIYRMVDSPFVYDIELTHILFEQVDRELTKEAQEALKKLFLTIILNKSHNGHISSFQPALRQYLSSNEYWAKLLFNTVLMLAKDSMSHNLYDASCVALLSGKDNVKYQPNISPALAGADRFIKEHGEHPYQSQDETIIQKYLLNEEDIAPYDFEINKYDISVLYHLANCGIPLTNKRLYDVMKATLHQMVEIWYANNRNRTHSAMLDVFGEAEISTYLKNELINSERTDFVIDLLFLEADYSRFVSDTYEFYEEVLIGYLPQYFDAYDNASERRRYKGIAEKIEAHVLGITDEKTRTQLYRVLFLPSPQFYRGDWSNCRTTYSYPEKQFINSLWEKYGQYHLKALLTALYELHISELLPEVLPAVYLSFREAKEKGTDSAGLAISQNKTRINEIITTAFVEKEDQIKHSLKLTASFESFLELLVEFNIELAAVILDEFRIH